MILLLAVGAGLLAGAARAWLGKRRLAVPHLRLLWLAAAAFLPQWLAFYLPATRKLIPDDLAAAALIGSQALLLIFAWLNRRQPGFWALGLGLALNLLVITLNGGLMPISPEVVMQLAPEAPPTAWQVGCRLGTGKDVVLPVAATQVWWLSDRFLLPPWFPYQAAFSLGDVLIAVGAFWLLWTIGDTVDDRDQAGDEDDGTLSQERSVTQRRAEQTGHSGGGQSEVLQPVADQSNGRVIVRLQR